MRYALIGCGRISPHHIMAAKNNELEIVAVCDVDPEKLEKTAAHLDHVHKYTDYKIMLEIESPDLVAIATESGKHTQIALDCIMACCHVIIEKPIALSIEAADQIIQLAKQKGVLVCVNHQNRFNKSIQYIHSAIEQGRFGRLLHGSARTLWNRNQKYYEQAAWRGTWEQDGGALMNQCIHNIDLLCWLMGSEAVEVFAYTDNLKHPFIEAEDVGLALVKFQNGTYGVIEGTTNVYPENMEESLTLLGETGTAKVGGKSVNEILTWKVADELDDSDYVKKTFSEMPPNVYGYGHTPLYADMIDAIKNGRQPLVNGEAGKRAMELILAIYQSASEKLPVRLPLLRGKTLDYTGRFENE